ncbi:MAG: sulfite exporter TauE/SafE family protein [bacterium]|nr:sulfite exporter TauE/SafE family protein [bacterium]
MNSPFHINTLMMIGVLIAAHTVESVLGFGATIIAFGIGTYFYPVNTLIVLLVFLALLQSAWLIYKWFSHIEWRKILRTILPLALVGVVLGIIIRSHTNEDILKTILGLFIICISAVELVKVIPARGTAGKTLSPVTGFVFIFSGGIFHGLLAIGGPLIVYYASKQLSSQESIKGTLSFVWFIMNIVMLAGFITGSQITLEILGTGAMLLPGLAAGIYIGTLLSVPDRVFKIATYILLLVIGGSLVIQ